MRRRLVEWRHRAWLSRRDFLHFFHPVTLTFWPLIDGQCIVMDYLCAKFGNFSFSRFAFIVRTDRQTDRQSHRITEADNRYTHATTIGVWVIIETKSWPLDRGANSRLTRATRSPSMFLHCVTLWPWSLTFWPETILLVGYPKVIP